MKIFATRVWGFDPSVWPVITFGLRVNRDKLLKDADPGDRIVFVGTQDVPTPEPLRGKLLGMAEIGRLAVDTLDVISEEAIDPEDYDAHGHFRWPTAILMVRAWRFHPQRRLLEVLSEQLSYDATPRAVRLSDDDAGKVLALNAVEVELPVTEVLKKARLLDQALRGSKPTRGPTPSTWAGSTGRDVNRDAFTYALRFGKTDTWKIGHAVNVAQRVRDVNRHIPPEVVPAAWHAIYQQPWSDEIDAHAMEQRVLEALGRFRTEGERVRCSEQEVWSAWKSAIGM